VPPKRLKRFHRHFPGVGVIRRSSGTRKAGEFHARDAVLTKLWKADRLDLLRDFRDAKISINELMDLDRRGILLRATAQDAVTHRPLWGAPGNGTRASWRDSRPGSSSASAPPSRNSQPSIGPRCENAGQVAPRIGTMSGGR
jgi:hypothetical protein